MLDSIIFFNKRQHNSLDAFTYIYKPVLTFLLDVFEVSGRFEFFQRIFAYSPVYKHSIGVSNTTQRALSNGKTRFSIVSTTI